MNEGGVSGLPVVRCSTTSYNSGRDMRMQRVGRSCLLAWLAAGLAGAFELRGKFQVVTRRVFVSVGKRIRSARETAGMTQAEVAKELGVSESSIRLYELGKRQPNDEVLGRIAEAVGVDPHAFIEIETGSVRDVLEILFRLEDACGLVPLEDGKLDVDRMNEHAPKLVVAIEKWSEMKRKLDEGEITESDYEAWKSRVR